MKTTPKPPRLGQTTATAPQNATVTLSLSKNRYGTPQPQVDFFLPRGSSHRETSAMLYTFAASLELRTPTSERWIVQTERLEEANHGRVYLELSKGDHAEAMRGMALLNAVLPR
ncbi:MULTISPECIES: hypothetical protein [Myxococcus]|nr:MULTISPECIES: hypothetical protein [Myxococcus]NOJ57511.1 hypothetical protein [Myxococcus xanthus]QPM81415.1 hypothetical protein I5Q59_09055 [Myxococcus xanthus]QVW70665.1 hypothetical protein JTM82_14415 [Myxococcus xanthus DZ2]QZZ49565.1 hypothetical protein MyxoNM_10150 [Myxococcus xanthus]UEO03208.1 hypothetical protein K1515_28400 [Myxococcus xanthus DZ2]